MKVRDLIKYLARFDEDAEVVIHRDNLNYGFGNIERLIPGVFEATDFGNDFIPDQNMLTSTEQIRAICLYPEDCYEASSGG